MGNEPTSVLTFEDLIIEASRRIGVSYYGPDGDGEIQVPIDAHDLSECKRHVNNAIRMILNDAPSPNGWRFMRPVASVVIWGDLAVDSSNLITSQGYVQGTGKTTLQVSSDSFYESMEEKSIVLTGVGTFTITDYVSATQIKVSGDASGAGASGVTWSITADGNFTLPRTFGGQVLGVPTYASDTNQGVSLNWTDESVIRRWRENITDETGDPYLLACRPMATGTPRRRWELVVYPKPDEVMTVEFPFHLHFDKMVDLDEVPPLPFSHDETVKAACLAVVEKDVEGVPGADWDYYKNTCLPNSYRIDAMAAPKRLGYFGNPQATTGSPIKFFRNYVYQRPDVTVNT